MDLTEFDLDFLSQRLSDNPQSPLFARLADIYVTRGQFDEALRLCERGVVSFPSYPSGFLVLGRCYLGLNQPPRALEVFRKALFLSPFNQLARKYVGELAQASAQSMGSEEHIPVEGAAIEELTPAAGDAVVLTAEESSEPLEDKKEYQSAGVSVMESPEEAVLDEEQIVTPVFKEPARVVQERPRGEPLSFPSLEDYVEQNVREIPRGQMITLDQYLNESPPEPPAVAGELDALASQLHGAGRIVPQEATPDSSPRESSDLEANIITPTLAEIYASQGEYAAAIQAYEILSLSRPDDREQFEQRIRELQTKISQRAG